MKHAENYQEILDLIQSEDMLLLYLSRPSCGVCTVLRPKIEEMLEGYPNISSRYVNIDDIPHASGQFSVFTVPGILFFIQGKETLREARHISVPVFEEKISRYYDLLFSS